MRAAAVVIACLTLSSYDTPAGPQAGGGAAASISTAVPRITNGRVVTQSAAGNLDAAFRRLVAAQSEPAWIGYAVPAVNRVEGRHCCSGDSWISDGIVFTNGRIATCGLESTSSSRTSWSARPRPSGTTECERAPPVGGAHHLRARCRGELSRLTM